MMHVFSFFYQQKVPDNLQFKTLYWYFGHTNGFIMQCENNLSLNILLRKLRIFIVNTFMKHYYNCWFS